MPAAHTGSNIAAVLQEAVEEWGLQPSPPLVSDNAANMLAAAKEFGAFLHVGCYAHTLNLACGKALKINSVSQLLSKMRSIVAYFHRSSYAAHVMKEKQILLQVPQHKLVIDVVTRWNSSLDMICRFLEQQPAVYAALTSKELRGKTNVATLNEADITAAEELQEILTPLKTATVALCEETVPTISMILPLQHQLTSFMAVKDSDTKLVKLVKEAISSNLATRYNDEQVRKHLLLAALLDPRFKLTPFLSEDEKLTAYHDLTVLTVSTASSVKGQTVVKKEPAESVSAEQEAVALPTLPQLESGVESPHKKMKQEIPRADIDKSKKPTAMSSLFGDVYITSVQPAKSTQEICENEVSQYKKEQPINASENPLIWWKYNCEKYPNLAIVAKKYLCVPATSVPSERVFSTAGDILTAQRSSLKAQYVDMLIFLKKNWHPTN